MLILLRKLWGRLCEAFMLDIMPSNASACNNRSMSHLIDDDTM